MTNDGHTVTGIGKECFRDCDVQSITLPATLVNIGEYAFMGCSQVTTMTIPASVDSIGNCAFYDMDALAEVTFEDSPNVIHLGYGGFTVSSGMFTQSPALKKVYIGRDFTHPLYKSMGYECGAFARIDAIEEVTFGPQVTVVPRWQFQMNNGLKKVTFGSGIKRVEKNAFSRCSGITELTLNEGLEHIDSTAFYYAESLPTVTLPSTLKSIYDRAFAGCKSIKSFTIPAAVDTIGYGVFDAMESLEELTIEDSPSLLCLDYGHGSTSSGMFTGNNALKKVYIGRNYRHGLKKGGVYDSNAFARNDAIEEVTYGPQVTQVQENEFYQNTSLLTVKVSPNATSIGRNAFSGCKKLETIESPATVTTIGDYAFYDCKSLKALPTLTNVTFIGHEAFRNNTSITSVTIPAAVDSIAPYAFSAYEGLQEVIIEDSPNELRLGSDNMFNYAYYSTTLKKMYIGRDYHSPGNYGIAHESRTVEEVTLGGQKTRVNENELRNYTALTNLTLGNSIRTIGKSAFYGCKQLNTIGTPENIEEIGPSAFGYCEALPAAPSLENVKVIGAEAFYRCLSFTELTIPAVVDSIGSYCFSDCSGLTKVVIADNATPLKMGSSNMFNAYNAFPELRYLYVGRDIEGPRGDNVLICNHSTIEEVVFGDLTTRVNEGEFSSCSALKRVTLGSGIQSIGRYAFSGTSALERFTCRAAVPPTVFHDAFYYIDKDKCTLYVPEASIPAYKAADDWKDFYKIEAGINGPALDTTADGQWYDLGGHRLSAPQRGVNIVRTVDGRTQKVVVR